MLGSATKLVGRTTAERTAYGPLTRAYVSPTDGRWAAFLRARPYLDEVNFWWPSGVGFKALQPGERFLFKAKARDGGRLIGGGLFSGYQRMRVSDAWRFFGEANGCATEAELPSRITAYRAGTAHHRTPTRVIGCAMVYDTFFVPGEAELAPPVGYPDSATRGRGYGPADSQWSALERTFAELASNSPIVELGTESDVVRYVEGARHGTPTLIVPRRGQRSFAALVNDAYERQCAITGGRIRPTLQAAHIIPFAREGLHSVPNGLLLRSDVHTLYDAGYLRVDPDFRLQVSERLRLDFGNGKEFYERAGEVIYLPRARVDWPARESLEWHLAERFLA